MFGKFLKDCWTIGLRCQMWGPFYKEKVMQSAAQDCKPIHFPLHWADATANFSCAAIYARWPSVYGIGIAVSFCNNQRQRNGAQTWLIVNCCSLNCYQWLVVFQLVASRKRKHRACTARMLEATWATIAAPSQQHHHIISYRPGTIEMPSTSRMGRNR